MQAPGDVATRRILSARATTDTATVVSDEATGTVGSQTVWNPTSLKRVALSHAFGSVFLGPKYYIPGNTTYFGCQTVADRSGYPCRISGYYPGRFAFTNPQGRDCFGNNGTDQEYGVRGRLTFANGTHRVLVQIHSFEARTTANHHPTRGKTMTLAQVAADAAIMEGAAVGTEPFDDGLNPTNASITWDDKFDAIGNALNLLTDNQLRRTMLRPFHEMTGGWYRWGVLCPTNLASNPGAPALETRLANAYRGMWQRMHTRVSARLGARASMLKWVWNVAGNIDLARAQGLAALCYPGDAYVDVISLDHYTETANGDTKFNNCANWMDAFLAAHPKPTAIDESGPHDDFDSTANHEATYPDWAAAVRDWCEGHMNNPATGLAHYIDYEVDADKNMIRLFRDRTMAMPGRENQGDAANPGPWSSTINGEWWPNNHPLLTTWMTTGWDDNHP